MTTGMFSHEYWNTIAELYREKPQEQKTGRWEYALYDNNPQLGNWNCSECGYIVVGCVVENEKDSIPLYKYCPQCGAKMVDPQESEDNV